MRLKHEPKHLHRLHSYAMCANRSLIAFILEAPLDSQRAFIHTVEFWVWVSNAICGSCRTRDATAIISMCKPTSSVNVCLSKRQNRERERARALIFSHMNVNVFIDVCLIFEQNYSRWMQNNNLFNKNAVAVSLNTVMWFALPLNVS